MLQLRGELEEQVSIVPARATLTAAPKARVRRAIDIFAFAECFFFVATETKDLLARCLADHLNSC